MKLQKSLLSVFVLLTIFTITSCSTTPTSNPTSVSSGDYYPLAINNEWTYTNGSNTNTGKVLSTSSINGNTYFYFGNTNVSTNAGTPGDMDSWMRKDGADYYQRLQVTANNGAYLVEADPFEYVLLKDNLTAGDTWVETITAVYHYTPVSQGVPAFPDQSITFSYNFTFVNSGLTKTVEGVTFNDVIQINLSTNINGTVSSSDTYFAKDVGIIEIEQNGSSSSRLTNYSLF